MLKVYGIIIVMGLLGGLGFGAKYYYDSTQARIAQLVENNARLETAVQTSEASLKLEKENNARMAALNTQLQGDLQKAEQYGDELRNTLQRHNLTHLATKKPGLIEPRMQNATDQLWKDLTAITTPPTDDGLQQPAETGEGNSNSNEN